MTVRRWYAGRHPVLGTEGVWLSRPGVDAPSATANGDFLLRPETKFEQIVLSGQVYIPLGGSPVTIMYPTTFTKTPYVFFKEHISDGVVEYPHNLDMAASDITIGGVTVYEVSVGIGIGNDRITVNNPSQNYNLFIDFMIFHRGIGT